ncbi:MAG: hypothetical protein ACI39H_00380 [Lachnospiraceae bacterium]
MDKKYESFIDLAPGYESVIDLHSDSDAEFWSRYIVTDDMVAAVKVLGRTLRPDVTAAKDDKKEDVKHFWLKGSYGTGKTYAAIVLKHLLEDDYDVVEQFLKGNKKFADVKDRFLGARKKGRYPVKFRSGECLQLNTSNKFLFQIEQSVREVLKENGFAYTGGNSLIKSVQTAEKMFRSTLAEQFDDGAFPEYWSTYSSYDDFANLIDGGDVDACTQAQEILESLNIGLATDLDTFKVWIKDVFAGNPELAKTGIFIIWDEFTEYIRHNDLDIIQQLSLFAKEQPLYIIYVMHEFPGLFSDDVEAGMGKADARFHKIDISITDNTTRQLIKESIVVKDGMKSNWSDICDDLYDTISDSASMFMGDLDEDIDASDLKSIFPIHPMTLELVTKVAGIAAAGRSIFKFLKSSDSEGFRTYIHDNGYYDWRWVTADYLWDYYFVNNSGGKKTLTKMAEDCLKHYARVADKISDEKALRVFKAAMLLLATVGSSQSMKKSKGSKGVQATQKTLETCFSGAIDKPALDSYLESLSSDPLNALVLAPDLHDGYRIELPYSGTGGELDAEISTIKTASPVSLLFEPEKPFGALLKKQFAPEEKAVVKRLVLRTCWGGSTQKIQNGFAILQKEVVKTNHRFGILVIAASTTEEIKKAASTAETLLETDGTNRILICVMNHILPQESINQWYEFMANASLAQKSNKTVNAKNYTSQADEIIGTWISTALGKDMSLVYGGKVSHIYTNKGVIATFEKTVLKLFPHAPENIIKKVTLYKSVSVAPAYYAVSRTTLQNKSAANDKQKNFNQQWQDVVDILRDNDEDIWDAATIDEIIGMSETKIGRCMSALCSYLNKQLTNGTVFLPDLWEGIQNELGYYDTGVCCYLLGFAFKFFEGKFTWHDGNNAHKLDEDTIPTMIVAMCSGKAAGMKLSSESDVEKRFKTLTQRVFGLGADEIGDVYECRKNVKVHITKGGYPVWAVKYIDESEFSGIKEPIAEIVEKYIEYILEVGSQTDVMEEIVGLFKPNVKTYMQVLANLIKDKEKMSDGLQTFIFTKSPEAKQVCQKYGFKAKDLITMLTKSLEEEIWQWQEEKVTNTIRKLILDLKLVGIVNKAFDGSAMSVEKIKETLSNYLGYIKVPGCVYADLTDSWAKAVQILYDISINKWVGYSEGEKNAVLDVLEQNCVEAIDNIGNPMIVLKKYIQKKGLGAFSEAEYQDILTYLPKEAFTQTESNFRANIKKKIEDLGYTKKVRTMQNTWKDATGYDSLKGWTDNFHIPAVWICPELSEALATLSAVESNERVDVLRIENAITDLQEADLSVMVDVGTIDRLFIINISSEKYVERLLPLKDSLYKKIAAKYNNPNLWPANIVSIRQIVEADVMNAVKAEAKSRAAKMSESELRSMIETLLENSSEACLLFAEK